MNMSTRMHTRKKALEWVLARECWHASAECQHASDETAKVMFIMFHIFCVFFWHWFFLISIMMVYVGSWSFQALAGCHLAGLALRRMSIILSDKQGLVDGPIKHHPTIGDIISNKYLKVMWNKSPKRIKKGHLPTPDKSYINCYGIAWASNASKAAWLVTPRLPGPGPT